MSQTTTPMPISHEPMADPTQRRFRGSAKINEYEIMNEKLGEGTFGIVSKARSKRTGAIVALKKILMHNEKEGFPITALREVKLLKMLSHPNILHLEEMAVERQQVDKKAKTGQKRAVLYMVMPYMDHDLSGMLTNPMIQFKVPQIKCYMHQLLEGLRYLHDSHILHRDMKAANILISNRGILQIADFGLARHYDGLTPQPGQGNGQAVRDYTSLVVTRWYRPPELLLTLKRYTPAIDLWGVGCIFGEMFERKPILEGRTDVDQCVRIFKLVGSPTEQSMPGWSELPGCEGHKEWNASKGDIDQRFGHRLGAEGLDLLKQLLNLDYRRRINAVDALKHAYFHTAPLPIRPEEIPQYEDSHELDARRRGQEKPRDIPPAPAGGDVGAGLNGYSTQGNGNFQGYGHDRGARYGHDLGPPGAHRGPPPREFDSRDGRPHAPPPGARQPDRWMQDSGSRRPTPSMSNGHGLPPRPPDVHLRGEPRGESRGEPPAVANRGGPLLDTYVPSYQGANGGGGSQAFDGRPPPRERERDRGRDRDREGSYEPVRSYRDGDTSRQYRGSQEGGYRDRGSQEGGYRDRDRDRDRERDRDRDRDRGGYSRPRDEQPRRTRSRSPWQRERLQERERELYRQQDERR